MRYRAWLWTLLALAAFAPAGRAASQPPDASGRTPFRIAGGASVARFDARATPVGPFHGETHEVSGVLLVDPAALAKGVGGTVSVGAATLRTGNGLRDSDLQVAMDTARYPVIRFTAARLESPVPALGLGQRVELAVAGTLEIHGVERGLRVPVTVTRVAANRLEIQGQTSLRMTDYGIRPPQVFFFIRVEDEVRISFTLVAEAA